MSKTKDVFKGGAAGGATGGVIGATTSLIIGKAGLVFGGGGTAVGIGLLTTAGLVTGALAGAGAVILVGYGVKKYKEKNKQIGKG